MMPVTLVEVLILVIAEVYSGMGPIIRYNYAKVSALIKHSPADRSLVHIFDISLSLTRKTQISYNCHKNYSIFCP